MQGKVGFRPLPQPQEPFSKSPTPSLPSEIPSEWKQHFFGWAIFGKSREVLRDSFLVVVLGVVTATRFF